jgi:hypothetical protein
MTAEQNKKWEEEVLYYYPVHDYWDPFKELPEDEKPVPGGFYTQDEVIEFHRLQVYIYDPNVSDKESFIEEMGDFVTYDSWMEDEYLETDIHSYTTPKGEEIVVLCKYGRDG